MLEILTHLKEGRAEVAAAQLNILSNSTDLQELIDIGCADARIRGDLGLRRARRRFMAAMAVGELSEISAPKWSCSVEKVQITPPKNECVKLSIRQAEVLNCFKQGMTNAAAGEQLGISKETIKWHVKGLYKALGAKNRCSVIHQANLCGLL